MSIRLCFAVVQHVVEKPMPVAISDAPLPSSATAP
jgi:hypothetical protein